MNSQTYSYSSAYAMRARRVNVNQLMAIDGAVKKLEILAGKEQTTQRRLVRGIVSTYDEIQRNEHFSKECWDILLERMLKVLLEWRDTSKLPRATRRELTTLFPKLAAQVSEVYSLLPMELRTPEQVCYLNPVETIGEGGQGHVIKVLDDENHSFALKYALKCRTAHMVALKEERRILEELKLLPEHATKHLPRFYRPVEDTMHVGLLMSLYHGINLQAAVDNQRLNWRSARTLGVVLALTLEAVHRIGIVHLDIKPGNIFLRGGDRKSPDPVILDFGFATRLNKGNAPVESPLSPGDTRAFRSPEQEQGEKISIFTDIFLLGGTLGYCITHIPPMNREAFVSAIEEIGKQNAKATAFTDAVLKAVSLSPDQRFATMEDFANAAWPDRRIFEAASKVGPKANNRRVFIAGIAAAISLPIAFTGYRTFIAAPQNVGIAKAADGSKAALLDSDTNASNELQVNGEAKMAPLTGKMPDAAVQNDEKESDTDDSTFLSKPPLSGPEPKAIQTWLDIKEKETGIRLDEILQEQIKVSFDFVEPARANYMSTGFIFVNPDRVLQPFIDGLEYRIGDSLWKKLNGSQGQNVDSIRGNSIVDGQIVQVRFDSIAGPSEGIVKGPTFTYQFDLKTMRDNQLREWQERVESLGGNWRDKRNTFVYQDGWQPSSELLSKYADIRDVIVFENSDGRGVSVSLVDNVSSADGNAELFDSEQRFAQAMNSIPEHLRYRDQLHIAIIYRGRFNLGNNLEAIRKSILTLERNDRSLSSDTGSDIMNK